MSAKSKLETLERLAARRGLLPVAVTEQGDERWRDINEAQLAVACRELREGKPVSDLAVRRALKSRPRGHWLDSVPVAALGNVIRNLEQIVGGGL